MALTLPLPAFPILHAFMNVRLSNCRAVFVREATIRGAAGLNKHEPFALTEQAGPDGSSVLVCG
jgi:hypothetical protein